MPVEPRASKKVELCNNPVPVKDGYPDSICREADRVKTFREGTIMSAFCRDFPGHRGSADRPRVSRDKLRLHPFVGTWREPVPNSDVIPEIRRVIVHGEKVVCHRTEFLNERSPKFPHRNRRTDPECEHPPAIAETGLETFDSVMKQAGLFTKPFDDAFHIAEGETFTERKTAIQGDMRSGRF